MYIFHAQAEATRLFQLISLFYLFSYISLFFESIAKKLITLFSVTKTIISWFFNEIKTYLAIFYLSSAILISHNRLEHIALYFLRRNVYIFLHINWQPYLKGLIQDWFKLLAYVICTERYQYRIRNNHNGTGCPLGQERSGISENLAKCQEKVRKNGHNFVLSGKVRKYQRSVFSQNYVSHYSILKPASFFRN